MTAMARMLHLPIQLSHCLKNFEHQSPRRKNLTPPQLSSSTSAMNLSLSLNLITLLLFNHFFLSFSGPNTKYNACSQRIQCGDYLTDISYPFYDEETRPEYCGHPGFKLDCQLDGLRIKISSLNFYLLDIIDTTATVARTDTWSTNCPHNLVNTTLDPSLYEITSSDQNITFFYGCMNPVSDIVVRCPGDEAPFIGYYMTRKMQAESSWDLWEVCEGNLSFPILKSSEDTIDNSINKLLAVDMKSVFQQGFELGMIAEFGLCSECVKSGGQCGYNSSSYKFVCYCIDANYDTKCRANSVPQKGHIKKTKMILIPSATAAGIMMLGLLVFFSKHILQKCEPITQDRSVEDCLKNYASLVPRRYTYANVKKMTNSFKLKLGEGGYGTVFKGSLHDGHAVAVKVWKQSKGDGKDFINEVMSISRTSHVNIVPLLGFCFEGHKRALIYEFMPNGSLDKFISGRDSNNNKQSLSASKLLEIVVGIARGLEYLHRGCNIRIVHFDIKPHNILLDEEFTPKISDFGLAKSFKEKESIISMSGARGTAGYIAPEVFLKSFGGVSYKSDVYSYGMMVLEMAGYTKRVDHNAENNSSEMYFPQWIYKQLEQETTIDHGGILNEEELERKMVLVGLWCIQTTPVNRPPMSRVVEMLEGKAALLEVPPIPSLASPPRQQQPTDDGSGSFYSSTT